MGARARFPKPTEPYALLRVFGTNIIATEGDEWKHQRKIVAPAFSEVRGPSVAASISSAGGPAADWVHSAEEQQACMG